MEEIGVLGEVVEMLQFWTFMRTIFTAAAAIVMIMIEINLIHPMLEDIEHSELDWLGILFAESLQILII